MILEDESSERATHYDDKYEIKLSIVHCHEFCDVHHEKEFRSEKSTAAPKPIAPIVANFCQPGISTSSFLFLAVKILSAYATNSSYKR